MDYERLGRRLRLARERAQMTQTEVARILGVAPPTLSHYESGKRRMEALTLERLARLYAVPLRWLFTQEESEPDWEESLRLRGEDLSHEGRLGVSRLIEKVHCLEELYTRTETPILDTHSPFATLPDRHLTPDVVIERADEARRHFDVGLAPLADLRSFLEAEGYKIFTLPLGKGPQDLSGLYFQHPVLGPIICTNEDQAYSRRPFTMAHEFAHALFHYDRPAVLCRSDENLPIEQFANDFASYFLIPTSALFQWLRDMGISEVTRAEEVVHAARYFGVSFGAMRRRLVDEERLAANADLFSDDVRPITIARRLGYWPLPYEFGERPLPAEERLPRVYLELADRAVVERRISVRRAAEMLGITDIEMDERISDLTGVSERAESTIEANA